MGTTRRGFLERGAAAGIALSTAGLFIEQTPAFAAGSNVYAWGDNADGQLGNGTTTAHTTHGASVLSNVVDLDGGREHVVALDSSGAVWCWGHNQYGQIGDGTKTNRLVPTRVTFTGNPVITAIGTGHYHSMALDADGSVWCWGFNKWGILGDGTTTNRSRPVKVSGLTNAIAIAGARDHSLALRADGTVVAWGDNEFGNLGNGNTTSHPTPVVVTGLAGITAIAGGRDHSLAIGAGGAVWAWGWNQYGQIGDGSKTNKTTAVKAATLTGATAITAGANHSVALRNDGKVWVWGQNSYGQLGDGTGKSRTTPIALTLALQHRADRHGTPPHAGGDGGYHLRLG